LWSNYNEMFLPLWWRVDPHIWVVSFMRWKGVSLSKYCQGMKNSFIWKKRDRWRKVGMNCYYDKIRKWPRRLTSLTTIGVFTIPITHDLRVVSLAEWGSCCLISCFLCNIL
jgi:hypothetical protein